MPKFKLSQVQALWFAILLALFLAPADALANPAATDVKLDRPSAVVERCSSIIVGKETTKDGSVLLAHNEDLANYCAHHYVYAPHAKHLPGETVTLFGGTIIPQPAETYGYSATKIFDKAYSPGDITSGVNEHQVAIVNNMSYRRDAPTTLPTEGRIIWTELTQLALERAKTAREAVEIIGDLVHTYKLGGDSGAMFAVTDVNEGWWVEVTLEGQWAAQRVPDNSFGVRANIFRIGEIDFADSENFKYSSDVVSYAQSMGWYKEGEPFHFAKTYAAPEKLNDPYNTRRQWRAEEMLAQQPRQLTPASIIAVLRDHYEGTPYDLTNGYKKGSPIKPTSEPFAAPTPKSASFAKPALGCRRKSALSPGELWPRLAPASLRPGITGTQPFRKHLNAVPISTPKTLRIGPSAICPVTPTCATKA